MRDLVIQTEHLSEDASRWLAQRCELVKCAADDAQFKSLLHRAAGLVVRTYTVVDDALLEKAPKLKVVARAGAGLDNIDVNACRRRGIEVVYAPDANTQAVVEYVIALMFDHLRPRLAINRSIDSSEWSSLREETVGLRQLSELTLGSLGLGRVGKGLARAAGGIGMNVIYNDVMDIVPAERFGAEPVDVRTLFATADVLSVHVDGRSANRGFVNAELLGQLNSQAILINSARGFVVDNLPLAAWLKSNPGATALLDVHEPEPFGSEYPLLGLPNAKLYPHLASRTHTAMNNMSWVVRDVVAVLEGRKPESAAPIDCSMTRIQ
jgi:phosphoglycerate dehydrogenase-like enzyme